VKKLQVFIKPKALSPSSQNLTVVNQKCVFTFDWKTLGEETVDGRIILKFVLEEYVLKL